MAAPIKLTVAQLDAAVILEEVELYPSEKVSTIIDKVKQALGHFCVVELIRKHGDTLTLLKDVSIEESGLEDGSTLTAVIKKPNVGTVWCGESSATLHEDGSVSTSGTEDDHYGIDEVRHQLRSGVVHLCKAFAATKDDGSIVVWGKISGYGDSVQKFFRPVRERVASGVVAVFYGPHRYGALKDDGSMVFVSFDTSGYQKFLRAELREQARAYASEYHPHLLELIRDDDPRDVGNFSWEQLATWADNQRRNYPEWNLEDFPSHFL